MKVGKSMQELSESGELKTFFDRRLIKALGHPVREHILAVLNERIASASEIGEEMGADVSSFYHHIEELEKLGCIERVGSRQRRGATEHFFRAKQTVLLDDEAWRQVPASLKNDLASSFMQQVFDEAAAAVEGGTFDSSAEHVSWTRADFDTQGWADATALLDQTLERLLAIRQESASRLAGGASGCTTAMIALLAFEAPRRRGVRANARARRPGRKQHRASAR